MSQIVIEQQVQHATLKPALRGAFTANAIYRVELPAGMSLYKVTQSGAVSTSGNLIVGPSGFVTPWWFSYEPLAVRDSRFGGIHVRGIADVMENVSRSRAGSIQEFLRSRGAVCLDWNQLTHVLVVELRRSAIGIVGTCSGQPVYDDLGLRQASRVENIRFIGGEQQFYVAGLRPSDIAIRCFGELP